MSLEFGRASFDFAQDEAVILMPSTFSPHPELVEGRTIPMQRYVRLPGTRLCCRTAHALRLKPRKNEVDDDAA
jgi:hypothetical protein